MSNSRLPPETLALIEQHEGGWSTHAAQDSVSLDLDWGDVIQVARTAETWKREKDEKELAIDGWKDTVTGRDLRGRKMYLVGKRVYYRGESCWYVITFHEAC